jgi:hypothetical protein
VKEAEVMHQSRRSGEDFGKIEQVRWTPGTDQWQELACFEGLAGIGSKLRHDAFNDWIEDVLR